MAHQKRNTERATSVEHEFGFQTSLNLSSDEFSNPDLLQNIMSAESLRKYLGLDAEPCSNVALSVRERILQSLVHAKPDDMTDRSLYLPIIEFNKIFTIETIKALVKERYSQATNAELQVKISELSERRRLLGIFLVMKSLHRLDAFVRESVTDIHLPLKIVTSYLHHDTRTRTSNEINTTLLKGWDANELRLFYDYQLMFFVPFFDIQKNGLRPYVLDRQVRLPWQSIKYKTSGGNGIVHKIKIHPSHHNFTPTRKPHQPLYFALKEIKTTDDLKYRLELSALEKICASIRKEKHLIKLLLTFKHGYKFYFLFEWADGNLGEFWELFPDGPTRSMKATGWAAQQCLGLANAVKRIHGLATWQKKNRDESSSQGASCADTHEWGRHGDIKPTNILWFSSHDQDSDLFVLSDLGLTRFHSAATRSLVLNTGIEGYTMTYSPPEMALRECISQKYDIWSLGCVYLEFCIWWLEGLEAVRKFENERTAGDEHFDVMQIDDFFVTIEIDGRHQPEVKPVVLKWIQRLRSEHQEDPFVQSMLNLIEQNMLVVNKADRLSADFICAAISQIVTEQAQQAKADSGRRAQ
ncbi:hypothetical protein QQS21_007263 [Conoideocrella luteorostrata]|uniref:Protein kinase domain-containing protein n=1 Tax=Conoideocrella luteorostrata TaxID=1105319 RepID=A0AAJ0CNS4_9HYPO|nr:hypothetical protein QQS21_007263 [Conoideocrella luteorostrata]